MVVEADISVMKSNVSHQSQEIICIWEELSHKFNVAAAEKVTEIVFRMRIHCGHQWSKNMLIRRLKM